MTDQELRDLVDRIAVQTERMAITIEADRKAAELTREAADLARKADREAADLARKADRESADLARKADRKAADLIREADREADRKAADLIRKAAEAYYKKGEAERKALNKQIGEMHRKWGTFTEALLMPSIEKLLHNKFGIEVTTANLKSHKEDEGIELDAFGYVNSAINTAVIVEVKSHLRAESITQMLTTMARFNYFFPGHEDKKLYGIMACVSAPENLRQELRKHGIYLALIDDVMLKMKDDKRFVPTDFNKI